MGRVAEGASGISSGLSCAAAALARHNANPNDSANVSPDDTPSLIAALIFVAIPKPSSFLFSSNACWARASRLPAVLH